MDTLLRQFNGDVHTKEAVIEYLTDFIAAEGVRRIFRREDVSAVADAKDLIDKAFEALKDQYAIPTKEKAPTNQAR